MSPQLPRSWPSTETFCLSRSYTEPIDAGVGARATYGRDPDGNVVELFEITDKDSSFSLAAT